jgi:hypothetical protein
VNLLEIEKKKEEEEEVIHGVYGFCLVEWKSYNINIARLFIIK